MVRSYSRTYVIIGSTFGDDMTFSITQRNDSPAIAESLKRVLENYGFETCLKDMGYINKDVLIKEELKTV